MKLGHNVCIAHSEQYNSFKYKTVLDEILYMDNISLSIQQARDYLALFLFYADDVNKEITALSGGEKSRLNLLKTMIQGANLIILDEPTNHLDINSVEALEDALSNYDGTLILVSHDRFFLNRVCDNILIFEDNNIKHYDGNYNYYLTRKEKQDNIDSQKKHQQKNRKSTSNISLNKISLRIKEVEKLVLDIENEIKIFETILCQPDFYKEINNKEIIEAYKNKKTLLEEYETEWLDLTEKLN